MDAELEIIFSLKLIENEDMISEYCVQIKNVY